MLLCETEIILHYKKQTSQALKRIFLNRWSKVPITNQNHSDIVIIFGLRYL